MNSDKKTIAKTAAVATSTLLYTCNKAGICTSVEMGSSGHYVNAADVSILISCSTENCNTITALVGHYISAIKENIILCADYTPIKCNSYVHGASSSNPKHYLDNTTSKQIITCTDSSCFKEDPLISGYFLNSALKADYSVIKCVGDGSTGCSEIADSSLATYNGVGTIRVDHSDTNILVTLCVSGDCSSTGVVIESSDSEAIYRTITVEANKFPNVGTAKTISIKIGNDGSVILLEDTGLDDCIPGSCETGVYCLSSNKIQTGSDTCSDITGSGADVTDTLYFKRDGTKIDTPDPSTSVPDMVYQCEFSGSVLQKCSLVKGYTITAGGKAVTCSGWKREACIVDDPPTTDNCETDAGDGKLIAS